MPSVKPDKIQLYIGSSLLVRFFKLFPAGHDRKPPIRFPKGAWSLESSGNQAQLRDGVVCGDCHDLELLLKAAVSHQVKTRDV